MQENQSLVYQRKVPCRNFGVNDILEARYQDHARGSLLILDRRLPTDVSMEIGVAHDRHVFRDGTSPLVQPEVI
jgi:hypothetical protein